MTTMSLEEQREAAQEDIRSLRKEIAHLGQPAIDLILTRARSHYAWQDKPVADEQIRQMYDIVKMGSTSMNTCPARFVFINTNEGRERLSKALKPANVPKVMGAPLTVIIAWDRDFWKELPRLFPHEDPSRQRTFL